MVAARGTSLWRVAGLSYLEYANKAAAVVRQALKEPVKSQVAARDNVHFAGFKWQNGVRGSKVVVNSLKEAAAAFKSSL